MLRRGSSRFADIVTVVVVLGVFLIVVGIFAIPEFTSADGREWGIDVEEDTSGSEFEVERLQANFATQETVLGCGVEDVLNQQTGE